MFNIRKSLFETNSSAVHALVLNKNNYHRLDKIVIHEISTFDQTIFKTVEDKVSYLACFIIYQLNMRDGLDIEEIRQSYQFKEFTHDIKNIVGATVEIPENFNINHIEFNHQLVEDVYDVDGFICSICGLPPRRALQMILDDATSIDVFYD